MLAPADQNALEKLERSMGESFRELKEMIAALDQRLRAIETTENGCRQVQDLRVSQLEQKYNDLDRRITLAETKVQSAKDERQKQIGDLEDRIEKLEPWVKGFAWGAAALGFSVLALIWGVVTHTVTLVFH